MNKRTLCSANCGRIAVARGLCSRCYQQEYAKHGRRWPDPRYKRRTSSPLASPPPCMADRCPGRAIEGGSFCREHQRRAEEWNRDQEESMTVCCFKDCGEIIDPEMFGDEFACCDHHRMLVGQAIELEEWGVAKDCHDYLAVPDWVSARWIASILGRTDESRALIRRVCGETPIFRVVADTTSALYAGLPFLHGRGKPTRPCSVAGCIRPLFGHGYCRAHLYRFQAHGDPTVTLRERGRHATCTVEGCAEKHWSRGFCRAHYLRWKRRQDPEGVRRYQQRYRAQNREKIREYKRRWLAERKDDPTPPPPS